MARPIRNQPPWHFRLAKSLIRSGRWGGYHLVELAEWLGCLNHDVRFTLPGGVTLDVPMDRRPNQWALPDLLAYEAALVNQFAQAAATLPPPLRWIDVGADIGALTALVLSRIPGLAELVVLEPNPASFAYLQRNAARWTSPTRALRAAAGEQAGHGRLVRSPTDRSDHAMFLQPDEAGDLEIVRLDDLVAWNDGTLLLKVDVEGGELAVLRGAERLLRRIPRWLLAFEAHRDVCRRTGVDPAQTVRWLQTLRPCAVLVAERPDLVIDWQRDYFAQVPRDLPISNVTCLCRESPEVG